MAACPVPSLRNNILFMLVAIINTAENRTWLSVDFLYVFGAKTTAKIVGCFVFGRALHAVWRHTSAPNA